MSEARLCFYIVAALLMFAGFTFYVEYAYKSDCPRGGVTSSGIARCR